MRFRYPRSSAGYSLVEVVMAAAIIAAVFGVILNCYIQSGLRAQWAGYSLAAQSLATEQVEQARAAIWDPCLGTSGKNEITNLGQYWASWTYTSSNQTWSGYTTNILDVPYSKTNYTVATNFVSVQLISLDSQNNILIEMIRVDTVWPFTYRRGNLIFTNTTAIILAPDNRDQSAL